MINNTFNNRKKFSNEMFVAIMNEVRKNRHDTGTGFFDLETGEVDGNVNPDFGGYEVYGYNDDDFHIRCVFIDIIPEFRENDIKYTLKYQIENYKKDSVKKYSVDAKNGLDGYNKILKSIRESAQ